MSIHRFGAIDRVAFDVDVEPDEDVRGSAYLALWAGGTRLGSGAATVKELTVTPSLKLGDRLMFGTPTELESGRDADRECFIHSP